MALTGMVARREEAKALRAGCDAYLTKPINVRAFRETLRLALGVGPIGPRGTPRRRQ